MRYALLALLLTSCSGLETRMESSGLLSGIDDRKHGSARIPDAAAWDAFRKTHQRVAGRSKRDAHGEPLPDLDFKDREYVIVWSGTMYRTLETKITDALEVTEKYPDFDENAAARMLGAGNYEIHSFPRGRAPEVRWLDR